MLTLIVHAMTAQLVPFLGSWDFPALKRLCVYEDAPATLKEQLSRAIVHAMHTGDSLSLLPGLVSGRFTGI